MISATVDQQETTTSQTESATTIRRKRLIVIVFSAVTVCLLLGLLWFLWPAGTTGSSSSLPPGGSAQKSSKGGVGSVAIMKAAPVQKMVHFVTTNKTAVFVSVFLALVVLSTIVVLTVLFTSTNTDQLLDSGENDDLPFVDIIREDPGLSIWAIIIGVIGAILVLLGTGSAIHYRVSLRGSDIDVRELMKDINQQRESMTDDQKCKWTKETKDATHSSQFIMMKGVRSEIFCPSGFSWNSVWWAMKTKYIAVDLSNKVVEFHDCNFIAVDLNPNDEWQMGQLAVQDRPIINPPGVGDIPPAPWSDELEKDNKLQQEYENWKTFAAKDTSKCQVVTEENEKSTANVTLPNMLWQVPNWVQIGETLLKCDNNNPSISSLFNAIKSEHEKRIIFLNGDQLAIYHMEDLNVDTARAWVWLMYEPFQEESDEEEADEEE